MQHRAGTLRRMGRKRALTTGRDSEQVTVRLPEGMRDELNRLALQNDRAANGEIVNRLRKSLNPHEAPEYAAIRELIGSELSSLHQELHDLRLQLAKVTEHLLGKK